MFHLDRTMSYWLYPRATDMRKGFFTLAGIVNNQMKRDVRQGEVFIFINRRRTSMKILHLECGGLVVYHLHLAEGCFSLSEYDPDSHAFHTSWESLMQMVQHKKEGRKRR
jgi:transposase